ncbi:MAG: 50S ribosomal protein L25 [Anaerolineaceae bacterium]|nr:50S ribosomal protein L25 [Anaerolineaceae bacterium]
MERVVIKATKRDVTGKKVSQLRREGKMPGVVYGHHIEPIAIVMDAREVTRAMIGLTPSSIVTIDIDGEDHAALIRERQRDFLRNKFIHIDFQAVSRTEKIRARIETVLEGVAPAVKNYNGIVLHEKEYIEVEALPEHLPERFIVDISNLNRIGDMIRISDLSIADDVTVFDDVNDVIVSISGVKEETEEEETTSADEPEVVEKGKKEEEA